jgi:hypothetical protein
MECESVVFSGHAIRRMFERSIATDAVLAVVADGETMTEYVDDTPYPAVCYSALRTGGRYTFLSLRMNRVASAS